MPSFGAYVESSDVFHTTQGISNGVSCMRMLLQHKHGLQHEFVEKIVVLLGRLDLTKTSQQCRDFNKIIVNTAYRC